jgi:hypothetical protein
MSNQCLLYPRKRTFLSAVSMSALGQKRTSPLFTPYIEGASAASLENSSGE